MASRKIAADLFLSRCYLLRRQRLLVPPHRLQVFPRSLVSSPNRHWCRREYSVFNEFSKKIKGEVDRNQEFQKSMKEIKNKAEELKGVKEDLMARTKQTTEQLYKRVDGVWNEAEGKAKKVYADVEEKLSAAKEEVKESFGIGKESPENGSKDSSGEEKNPGQGQEQGQGQGHSQSTDNAETIFGKVKFGVSSISPKVSLAFQRLKEAKPLDFAKKGYDIVKDELKGNPNRRKRLEYDVSSATPPPNIQKSTRTDIVVLPSKQSRWNKKWEAFKTKMQGHPLFKRVSRIGEPVIEKSQEIAEDMRERWETSDHPVVHKIQDISETVLGESDAAMSFKEIRRRDPTFSLPEFVAEVQEVIKPVLNAYFKGDTGVLGKYCTSHVIERCKAEHKAYESQGIFFDNKILHISDVEVRETKMMGETPIIIVAFQTQQVYCIRDRLGAITEGGQDTIHTVYYAWAMQQLDPEELGDGAPYSIWKLREMQQLGVRALI
ncbi:mitochondrial import inner membrane translocase subunit TIM44-2-like [Andrographis paniculata]|uniref:mitochondrial import inner membrane translocase subunit TIM44-2-like n=1 Tax=Andrographis paniculata TaxID=175694 RepID=UPI0021E73419|nr:mitochondrial import inner membrane translocase subunit TIM44-2-like [Andrographis paniculata]